MRNKARNIAGSEGNLGGLSGVKDMYSDGGDSYVKDNSVSACDDGT